MATSCVAGVDTVRASAFGWKADDATVCLQSAIDSGARRVIVDRQVSDWIIRPVFVRRSNVEIVFAEGVVVRAKKDAFHAIVDSLVTIQYATNVTLRGEGKARLEMNKRDYLDRTRYSFSEWRMGVLVGGGTKDVTLRNLEIISSGGDGVYVNGSQDVVLEDLVCRDHNRQGISIIQVNGLTARRCRFETTDGAPPMAGLDFEPNNARNYCENAVFEDCVFANNKASGVILCLNHFTAASRPVSIVLRNCEMVGNAYCGVTYSCTTARGKVRLENCRMSGNGSHPLSIHGQMGSIQLTLKDCVLDARNISQAALSLENGGSTNDIANIAFENVQLLVGEGKPYELKVLEGVGLKNLSGALDIVASNGTKTRLTAAELMARHPPRPELKVFQIHEPKFEDLRPVGTFAKLAKPVATPFFRYRQTFVQYVPAAGEYPIRLQVIPARNSKPKGQIKVTTPGAAIETVDFEGRTTEYVIRAVKPNIFFLEIEVVHGGQICVESPWPGCGTLASRGVYLLGKPRERFYFSVPVGAQCVLAKFAPTVREPAAGRLIDPAGQVVAERPYSDEGAILRTPKGASLAAGLWQLELPKVYDDCTLWLGGDAQPIFFFSPETVLR